MNLDGELEDVGRQGRPLRHRNDKVLNAVGGERVGIGDAVAEGDDRRRIAGGESKVKRPLQQLRIIGRRTSAIVPNFERPDAESILAVEVGERHFRQIV